MKYTKRAFPGGQAHSIEEAGRSGVEIEVHRRRLHDLRVLLG